ncbi:hypothetical protein [Massilia glaciei]|uniref:DUF4410 domain-containing protein n=1 Tax=Massilia glaciei TaxID=1524097 RepID=A0A2U2HKC2_9BURK|nr:hypothetical protein [Massilia glaciei]PWF47933.1 hypothetical protein C7C56_013280 [Massilia glaciei]
MHTRFLSCLLVLALALPAAAAPTLVTIGEANIKLPEPAGFIDPTPFSAEGAQRLRALVDNDKQRFVATFFLQGDVDELKLGKMPGMARVFSLRTMRAMEERKFGPGEIKDIKETIKRKHEERRGSFEIGGGAGRKLAADQIDLRVGELAPLGVFNETANSVSVAFLTKKAGAPGNGHEVLVQTFIFLKGKNMLMHTISSFRSDDDIAWARAASAEWVAAATKIN